MKGIYARCETCGSKDVYIARQPRERTECNDGTTLSIQASETAYSEPRDNDGPYSQVEVGFVDGRDDEVEFYPYGDSGEGPSDVYGYVPVAVVEAFIARHGGRKFFV